MPSLRFPEFLNDREWELVHIGRYYKLQGGFAFKSCYFKDSGIPIIRIANIPNDGAFVDTSNCVCYEAIANDSNYIVSMGDLLIAMSGATIGKTAIFHEPHNAYLNQRVGLFKSINVDNYYPFLCQWVKSECFSRQLKRTLAAGAQPNISSKDIESFIWAYPIGNSSNKEQRKIADCLTSLDRYIYNTKSKLQQLKAHKRGLMQRLFPTKGKTVPELRFPEFRNSEEWKDYAIRDIFERITERNRIGCRNVLTISAQYGIVSQSEYFNKNVAAADLSNYYLIKRGDFAYNKSRSQGYTYGIIRPLNLYKDGIVSPIYLCFRIKQGITCCRDFLEYLFDTVPLLDNLGEIAQEGARNHGLLNIATEDFFDKMRLTIPVTIDEQQKIADCLSSINGEIKSYEDKITALELHKKGLMQQLFPKL